jgi:hypothetical protein
MGEVKHTALPWSCAPDNEKRPKDDWVLMCEEGMLGALLSKENAAFIVRACNSHYDLVEAAEAALSLISDDGKQGGKNWTMRALKDAIAKAKGAA